MCGRNFRVKLKTLGIQKEIVHPELNNRQKILSRSEGFYM